MGESPVLVAIRLQAKGHAPRNQHKPIRRIASADNLTHDLGSKWLDAFRGEVMLPDLALFVQVLLRKPGEGIKAIEAAVRPHQFPDELGGPPVLRPDLDVIAFWKRGDLFEKSHEVHDSNRIPFLLVIVVTPSGDLLEKLSFTWLLVNTVGKRLKDPVFEVRRCF